MAAKNHWLMKSEPDEYSIDDLEDDEVEMWDGVRNYQVRNMMRDEMRVGDRALFYHSNAGKDTGVVGVMEIVKSAYPDPTQFDPQDAHYDPKSDPDAPRWLCVDVRFLEKLPRVVPLSEIKELKQFADLPLVRKGNRLSVMPIKKTHFGALIARAKR